MSRANEVLRKMYLDVYSQQIHFRYETNYEMMQFSSNKSFKDTGILVTGVRLPNRVTITNSTAL